MYYRIIIKVINFKVMTNVSNRSISNRARFFYQTIIQIISFIRWILEYFGYSISAEIDFPSNFFSSYLSESTLRWNCVFVDLTHFQVLEIFVFDEKISFRLLNIQIIATSSSLTAIHSFERNKHFFF